MRLRPIVAVAALSLFATTSFAQVKPEDAIQYRKAQYTVLLWNWVPMSGMVRGRVPFDQADFARRAALAASVAPQLLEGFPQGSGSGAPTEAKPEIWANYSDFSAKMDAFVKESAKLAEVAKGSDETATKAQFAKTSETCKACHDLYKAD